MSALLKAAIENSTSPRGDVVMTTRVNSLQITQEKKSSDFDTSSVRSPVPMRKGSTRPPGLHLEGMSPAAAEKAFNITYTIQNSNFARGAYGKVEVGFNKMTQARVAIKRIPKTTPYKMIKAEVDAGEIVGAHDNIATYHKSYDLGDHYALVFQFVDGEDLFTYLERVGFTPLAEDDVRKVLRQVISAVQHTHSKGIAHRDIKLENILITKEAKAYLIDYGLCSISKPGEEKRLTREWCGSDNYLCPQIVRRQAYDGFEADVFSLGVVAFALLFGVFPFENLNVNSKYSNDPKRPLPRLLLRFPTDVPISREAKDLLYGMCEDDPEGRLTIEEILKHPWFVGSGSALQKMSND